MMPEQNNPENVLSDKSASASLEEIRFTTASTSQLMTPNKFYLISWVILMSVATFSFALSSGSFVWTLLFFSSIASYLILYAVFIASLKLSGIDVGILPRNVNAWRNAIIALATSTLIFLSAAYGYQLGLIIVPFICAVLAGIFEFYFGKYYRCVS